MRRILPIVTLLLSAALLIAQQSGSGIESGNQDPSVRPQDNFFLHVNGSWLAKIEIPADRSTYGASTELADKTELEVRRIVEDAIAAPNRVAGSAVQQVGDLYASFMNEARANELGATPITEELRKIDAITTTDEMAVGAGTLAAMSAGGPATGWIESDAQDPSTPMAYLTQSGTALPDRDYYLQDDSKFAAARQKYQEFLEKIFALAGRANATADAKAVLALETDLARIQWTRVDNRDPLKTYNKIALTDLSKEMPGFDWMAWARPQGLDRARSIIISQPSFFKGFAAMVPQTPLTTWKAWLAAHYLIFAAPYLSQPFVDANFEFGRALNGQLTQRERWKRGVTLVNKYVGMAIGRLYVAQTFPPESKTRVQRLVTNLLEAYRQSIGSLDWMTAETRTQALAKLATFNTKIGYPDTWRGYSGLVIQPDDLLGNIQRAEKFETAYQKGKLGKPVDRTEWLATPQTINAYYNTALNEVVFPAAILQPPFFNADADDAVNYGGIGALIGHEIGHGFDDEGRHYDGTGALRDWWTEADAREFEKRAQRLVEQYNAAVALPGMHVNGALTLGENIGDLGGLSIAYKAYEISLGHRPSPSIDGMTGEQRFFIGYAQVWRAKRRDELTRQLLVSDPHSPPEFRVNIPLSNLQGFYDAFGVKPGDAMYRDVKDRARIW